MHTVHVFHLFAPMNARPLPPLAGSVLGGLGMHCTRLPTQTLWSHTWSMPGWVLLYNVRVSTCSGTSPWVCRRYSARRSFLGPKY